MRLLVISNRLPITVVERPDGMQFERSMGGLVSGLSSYLDSLGARPGSDLEYVWLGWPGITVDEAEQTEVTRQLEGQCQASPVFISEQDMDAFYHGFCNKTIWPLFHYFPERTVFEESCWDSYKRVNELFCDAVLRQMRPDDIVWIHDYHLMLLPQLLRQRAPKQPIGFFLHIPFPSYELFRMLPRHWSREILEGLLGSTLVGFHTDEYAAYFLQCVSFLSHKHREGTLRIDGRPVQAGTFPMGIDVQRFRDAATSSRAEEEKAALRKSVGDLKIVLSIDRLDYTKGIANRLLGYQSFLQQNPDWHGKVALLMILVPSRIGVDDYRDMKRQIDELVGRINGAFASVHWTPILYQYRYLPFEELVPLYAVGDVALVTPLKDGMNLIAKEYLASHGGLSGVLVLSETAGASQELAAAILVNPHHVDEIARGLKEALEMPMTEQGKRNRRMHAVLERSDVKQWAGSFIAALLALHDGRKTAGGPQLSRLQKFYHWLRSRPVEG